MTEQLLSSLLSSQWSVVSVLVLLLWMVVSGRLVPRRVHEEVRADRDAYRAAFERVREGETDRARAADEQTHEALRTLTHLVQAIPQGGRP